MLVASRGIGDRVRLHLMSGKDSVVQAAPAAAALGGCNHVLHHREARVCMAVHSSLFGHTMAHVGWP